MRRSLDLDPESVIGIPAIPEQIDDDSIALSMSEVVGVVQRVHSVCVSRARHLAELRELEIAFEKRRRVGAFLVRRWAGQVAIWPDHIRAHPETRVPIGRRSTDPCKRA